MSSTSQQLIPKLRFPEFSGSWEEKKLGDISIRLTKKNKENNDNVLTISGQHGLISQLEYFNKSVSAKDVSGYYLLEKGDFAYNKSYSNGYPMGAIKKLNRYEKGVVSTLYICFRVNKLTCSNFFEQYFESGNHNKEIQKVAQEGARNHGLLNIGVEDFFNTFTVIPYLPEQTKIASFLSAVDEKIKQLTDLKSAREKHKKGMLQQIFSKQIRFCDEDGNNFPEWEEKELGECLDYEQPTNYLVSSKNYDSSCSIPVVTAGKTFILGYTNEDHGIYQNNLPVIIFDDFTTATQFIDFPFKAKSSAMKILKAKKGYNIKFIYEIMQNINYEIGGHGRHWISVFSNLDIQLPSLPEQEKIANFLSQIDVKISEYSDQIEQAKQWKKGLLQGLFI